LCDAVLAPTRTLRGSQATAPSARATHSKARSFHVFSAIDNTNISRTSSVLHEHSIHTPGVSFRQLHDCQLSCSTAPFGHGVVFVPDSRSFRPRIHSLTQSRVQSVVTLSSLRELTLTGCNKLHFIGFDWQTHHSLHFSGVGSLKGHHTSTIQDAAQNMPTSLAWIMFNTQRSGGLLRQHHQGTVLSTERPIANSPILRLPHYWSISLSLALPTAEKLARLGNTVQYIATNPRAQLCRTKTHD
jgi:hypothetical protein